MIVLDKDLHRLSHPPGLTYRNLRNLPEAVVAAAAVRGGGVLPVVPMDWKRVQVS